MQPKFRWTCSYMGTVWYQVTDATGTYEAELRHQLSDYESSICNGDDVRQESRSAIGILRRSCPVKLTSGEYSFAVPRETVEAFNAWRAAEHAERVAKLRGDTDRYGIIADNDPILKAPIPAKHGEYVHGEYRWVVLSAELVIAA